MDRFRHRRRWARVPSTQRLSVSDLSHRRRRVTAGHTRSRCTDPYRGDTHNAAICQSCSERVRQRALQLSARSVFCSR